MTAEFAPWWMRVATERCRDRVVKIHRQFTPPVEVKYRDGSLVV